MTWNDPEFCEGVSATNALVDAAKEAPAIPSTDTALLGRFAFEARFACDIAEFLLYFASNKCATSSPCL
jgi:hypothetical protein